VFTKLYSLVVSDMMCINPLIKSLLNKIKQNANFIVHFACVKVVKYNITYEFMRDVFAVCHSTSN